MKVAGIVAEYNPLHNGHAYHISEVKRLTRCDYIIAIMSGSFVQRGEPAIFDKWARAAWALEAGADIIIELPALFALSSAERFARGSIQVLSKLGVLTHLCFGSEVADISVLKKAAKLLDEQPEHFKTELKTRLGSGLSYPRAQFEAFRELNLSDSLLKALSSPNGMLGIEYLRALDKVAPNVIPVPITRIGSEYNSVVFSGNFSSATAIRTALREKGIDKLLGSVPEYVWLGMRSLISSGKAPVWPDKFSELILYSFRKLEKAGIASIPDVDEGLENLFYKAAQESSTFDEMLSQVKSKRYTMSRLKRICMCALIGITKSDLNFALEPSTDLYARVLGFKKEAQPLLRAFKRYGSLPVIMRKSDMDILPAKTAHILDFDIIASDVHALGMPGSRSGGHDFTQKLIVF